MSKAKDTIIGFINLVFGLILVSGAIMYFSTGDNLEKSKSLIMLICIASIAIVVATTRFKISKKKFDRLKDAGDMTIVLHLSHYDKLKSEIIAIFIPTIILIIGYIINKKIDSTDIFQAITAAIVVWYLQNSLFKKE